MSTRVWTAIATIVAFLACVLVPAHAWQALVVQLAFMLGLQLGKRAK